MKTVSKLKRVALALATGACLGLTTPAAAQGTASEALPLTPYIPDSLLEASAREVLLAKLNNILTANGLSTSQWDGRFILTARPTVVTHDVTGTYPPKQAYTLDVNLAIGDGYDGKLFASHTITVKGAGDNESRAMISALRQLPARNEALTRFVEQGKSKIINYYDTHIDRLLREAQQLADRKEFERAMVLLGGVPSVCEAAYAKASAAIGKYYRGMLDQQARELLNQARTLWAATQSLDQAEKVAELLGQIDPSAPCFGEVEAFATQVGKRVKELDQREWDFKLQKQRDKTEVEKAQVESLKAIMTKFADGDHTFVYRPLL